MIGGKRGAAEKRLGSGRKHRTPDRTSLQVLCVTKNIKIDGENVKEQITGLSRSVIRHTLHFDN